MARFGSIPSSDEVEVGGGGFDPTPVPFQPSPTARSIRDALITLNLMEAAGAGEFDGDYDPFAAGGLSTDWVNVSGSTWSTASNVLETDDPISSIARGDYGDGEEYVKINLTAAGGGGERAFGLLMKNDFASTYLAFFVPNHTSFDPSLVAVVEGAETIIDSGTWTPSAGSVWAELTIDGNSVEANLYSSDPRSNPSAPVLDALAATLSGSAAIALGAAARGAAGLRLDTADSSLDDWSFIARDC